MMTMMEKWMLKKSNNVLKVRDLIMSKLLNFISTISCIIAIVLLYSFITITEGFYFNGSIVLLFLLMLLNPIANIFRLNKKIICNPIFHIFVIGSTTYTSYLLINSIMLYINNSKGVVDKTIALNTSRLFFYDKLIYILIVIFISLIISFLFKKEKVKSDKDNSIMMLLIILITSIVPLISKGIGTMGIISAGFNITQVIFTIIILFKLRSLNTASELQKYYFILMLTSLVSLNPISLVLSAYMYIQLDTFGLHI